MLIDGIFVSVNMYLEPGQPNFASSEVKLHTRDWKAREMDLRMSSYPHVHEFMKKSVSDG
jgi:hypothetical protein